MWVNHPLQVNQPGQLSLSSYRGQLWWRHLVNADEGKAGMVLFAGKTV